MCLLIWNGFFDLLLFFHYSVFSFLFSHLLKPAEKVTFCFLILHLRRIRWIIKMTFGLIFLHLRRIRLVIKIIPSKTWLIRKLIEEVYHFHWFIPIGPKQALCMNIIKFKTHDRGWNPHPQLNSYSPNKCYFYVVQEIFSPNQRESCKPHLSAFPPFHALPVLVN